MFGKKLQHLRKITNLKQEELAEKIGVSQKTISSWETDRTSPNIDDIKKLCEYFGVSMNYFSENTPVKFKAKDIGMSFEEWEESEKKKKDEITLLSVINNVEQLSKEDKQALAKILEYMLIVCKDEN